MSAAYMLTVVVLSSRSLDHYVVSYSVSCSSLF